MRADLFIRKIAAFSFLVIIHEAAQATTPVVPGAIAGAPQAVPIEIVSSFFSLENAPSARELLTGGSVTLPPAKEFVKLNIGFARPAKFSAVKLESCNGDFTDNVELFLYPGLRRVSVEGGKARVRLKLPIDRPLSAVTIVMNHLSPSCLKGLEFFDVENRSVRFDVPLEEQAQVEGEGVTRLFDFDPRRNAVIGGNSAAVINFDKEQTIDRIFAWNGDQLSSATFSSGDKLSGLNLTSDAKPARNADLSDRSGMQTIELKPALTGRKITIKSQTKGRLSELRFGSGIDAGAKIFTVRTSREEGELSRSFQSGGLAAVLDRDLATREESRAWNFRFRGDSSVFVYGYDDGELSRGRFNVIGRYEILTQEPKKLRLRIRGTRFGGASPWDGWFCGLACGEVESRAEMSVDETIVVEKVPAGAFMIRNRTASAKRTLPFGDLKTKVSSLAD